jgi:methionyl-tRNA formyltransferase
VSARTTVIIATPHARYDRLEARVREMLPDADIVRIRDRQELNREALEARAPSWIFLPHWSWTIPAEVFDSHRCVIFHMTDLPYGRGGSPLQNLIVRGHRETQLSALRCTAGIDAGPVYMKRPLELTGTAEDILLRAADLMAEMIPEIVRTSPEPVPQSGAVVSFARRRPEQGDLSTLAALAEVYDYIRMLDGEGYPRAFIEHGAFRFEFSAAEQLPDAVRASVLIRRK